MKYRNIKRLNGAKFKKNTTMRQRIKNKNRCFTTRMKTLADSKILVKENQTKAEKAKKALTMMFL